jgi:hypothetical protein
LDYVPESAQAGVLHVPLEPHMMEDVIPKILKELPQASRLTDNQLNHVVSFAHGFPQIATLMAETGDTLDWARLDQRKLATKILWGRDAPDERGMRIITWLSPQDLKLRLALLVTNAPYQHSEGPDGKYIDVAAEKAQRLAEEFVQNKTDFCAYLDDLQQGEQRQTWFFGYRLGQITPNGQEFIANCLSSLSALGRKFGDVFWVQAARANGFLDLAINSCKWVRVNFHSKGRAICS